MPVHASACQCQPLALLPGQRQVLDDIGVGQAVFLLTGLPPFLRVKELRPRDRGICSLAALKVSSWAAVVFATTIQSLGMCGEPYTS